MPLPSTMTPIATATISGSSTASFTFSSLPQGYTDLIVIKDGSQTGGSNTGLRYNGDSGSNYSATYVYGTGSAAGSGRDTSTTQMIFDYVPTTGNRTISKIQILNYSNTTTYKTMLWRRDDVVNATQAGVGLWRSTAAITSLTFVQTVGSSYFSDGTTFTLYGIKAA
jgi:hypothetical protein